MLPTTYTLHVRCIDADAPFEITVPEIPEMLVYGTTLNDALIKGQEAIAQLHYEEWKKTQDEQKTVA